MKTTEEKIVMYESPEAATYVTNVEGWIDINRRFFGKGQHGEEMARYSSCTHKTCDCGNKMTKGYVKCESCRHKAATERYNALPFREWDRIEPVVTFGGDNYFFNEEDLIEYMEENELKDIDLLFCAENNWRTVDNDYWADEMPENSDGELPKELQAALDNLNNVIKTLSPQSYSPGKIRTSYQIEPDN